MIVITNDVYKFIIITFAKSGCTTIRLICAQLEDENYTLENIENSDFVDMDKLKKYHVVCVYRNTFKRIVSSYVDKVLDFKTDIPDKYYPYYPTEARRSFNNFVDYLSNNLNDTGFDVHFQPQTLPDDYIPFIDQFVDIEHPDTIFSHDLELQSKFLNLLERNGIQNSLLKRDDIHYSLYDYDFEKDYNGLCVSKLAPSYRLFYNDTLIRHVQRMYSTELDLFNIHYPWKRHSLFISNTCTGWTLEKEYNGPSEYRHPFIGSLIPDDNDYLRLCEHFDYYMSLTPKVISETEVDMTKKWHQQTGRERWLINDHEKIDYVITRLDDIEIHWIHETNAQDLLLKYERRRLRIQDSIPIFTFQEHHSFIGMSDDQRQMFRQRFLNMEKITLMVLYDPPYEYTFNESNSKIIYPYNKDFFTRRNGNNNPIPAFPSGDNPLKHIYNDIKNTLE